jgi:tRNA A37 N6-isopentenylltransferase MiaA
MFLVKAMAATEIETRQYAKRQLTWFRGTSRHDARIVWFTGFGSDPAVANAALESVGKFLSG